MSEIILHVMMVFEREKKSKSLALIRVCREDINCKLPRENKDGPQVNVLQFMEVHIWFLKLKQRPLLNQQQMQVTKNKQVISVR